MDISPNRHGASTPIDFDLHGLVGIRLVGATPGDAAAVAGQLGLMPAALTRPPDIQIRFVDRLPISSTVRCLGRHDAGFTDDAFLLLRAKHKSRARVQIPFEQIGRRCEFVCESGLSHVPLLIDVLNLTMLAKGAVPIHASAFTYHGTGVLTVGWSQGGKTEALLAFMARGARYVGDEWVYLGGDGRTMFGIPEPIRVWDWHLQDLPIYRPRVGRAALTRLGAVRLARSMQRMWPRRILGRLAPATMLNRVASLLDRQLHVDVRPQRLFGKGFATEPARCDRVLLVISHESPEVLVQPIDPQEIAARMAFSLQEERGRLMSYYRKFRFAFPGKVNPLLEQADETHARLLSRALADKPAHVVYHPYPMRLSTLFEAVRPLCDRVTHLPSPAPKRRVPIEINAS